MPIWGEREHCLSFMYLGMAHQKKRKKERKQKEVRGEGNSFVQKRLEHAYL